MGIRTKIVQALRMPAADWLSIARAICDLFMARLALARHSPSDILRLVQASQHSIPNAMTPEAEVALNRISRAISVAAAVVPWRSDCLVQAIAAHRSLQRNGISGSLCIGVARSDAGELQAHAWLRAGNRIVTGGKIDRFELLSGPPPC